VDSIIEIRRERFLADLNAIDFAKILPLVSTRKEFFDTDFYFRLQKKAISEKSVQASVYLYNLLLSIDHLIEAEHALECAHTIDPENSTITYFLVDIYCRRKMIFHAVHFTAVLEKYPQSILYVNSKIKCSLLCGKFSECASLILENFEEHQANSDFIQLCFDFGFYHNSPEVMQKVCQ